MSINDSGQVVGGQYSSINNLGQYVGGQEAGIQTYNPSTGTVLVSGGTTTNLSSFLIPYSINAAGQIAGYVIVDSNGGNAFHPAVYQNGQVTDLFSTVASGLGYDSRAVAINQNGDMVFTVSPPDNSIHSYLYNSSTGTATEITGSAGSSGLLASALNNKDQVVGNGFLYSNGSLQSLLSLLPASSGWSNLDATGINDAGQIVGQGTYNGQEIAFLMTPDANGVPEPCTLAIWLVLAAAGTAGLARQRRPN
jgi:hypothetical protein